LINNTTIVRFSFLLIIAFSFSTCKSQKESAGGSIAGAEKEMLAQGFVKGTIIDYSQEKGCTYLIKKDETGELLLPLKLEDQFLKDNQKVWFKYQYSRRPQGSCLKGITITLGEIEIRE
jgi:hypothetical protein